MKEYNFIIWDKKFTIKNEEELVLIFEVLSWDINVSSLLHWNVIMELNENLLDIIKTYKWLLKCLKILNEKNSFLLLIKIWDSLNSIIKNSEELWEILARIPNEKNKLRIIKQIRPSWLKRLITVPKDLSNILEWIYDSSEEELLNILWYEYIQNLFSYPREINYALHYLNNDNKNLLINIIWKKNIVRKIKTSEDLLLIIKWVTKEKANEILKSFSRQEIKNLFLNDSDFVSFIKKLSERKEKIFLNHLWINYEW